MAIKIRDELKNIRTVKIAHGAATTKDTMYVIGTVHPALAINSALISTENEFVIDGLIEYTKVTTDVCTPLLTLYFDTAMTPPKLSLVNTGALYKAGYVWRAAGNGATTVECMLDSSLQS